MKEILYYDEETLNSILSQFGKGIIQSLQMEQSEISSDTLSTLDEGKIDSGLTMRIKLSSGVLPGGEVNLGGKFGGQAGVNFGTSQTVSEGQKDVLEKIFHDHALDLLIEKLDEKYSLETNPSQLNEGQFGFFEGKYKFYDFDLLTKITNPEILLQMTKMATDSVSPAERKKVLEFGRKVEEGKTLTKYEDTNKIELIAKYKSIKSEEEATLVFTMINTMSKYSNEVIKGLVLFKIDNNIIIGHKENMRVTSESLSFRAGSSLRNLKVIGKVIGEKDSNRKMQDLLTNFQPEDFDKFPSMMLDLLLTSLGISKKGDFIINPIAIYYEEN